MASLTKNTIDALVTTEPEQPATITISIRDQGGDETFFKILGTTKLSEVFNAFAAGRRFEGCQLAFNVDGDRIDMFGEETANSLELEDNDRIDCLLEATGCRFVYTGGIFIKNTRSTRTRYF